MKVKWTATSKKHLKSIHDYIASDSAAYARRRIDRIIRRTDQLESFPEFGGKVLEYDDSSVRELFEGPYRIIHRVRPDRVDILAVVHSARLLPETPPG